MISYHDWLIAHFSLFRLALFLCCFAYWITGYHWFKPSQAEVRASIMAAWVQISLGILLDARIVRLGFWQYRDLPFCLAGVPVDLHFDWALVWAFFLVWLYSRLRRYWQGLPFASVYLAIWTLFTLGFDAAVARQMLFLKAASPLWWLCDIVFLFLVQSVTLWVYHAILYLPPCRGVAVRACLVRSAAYLGGLIYLFYGYAPAIVLSLTHGWGAQPVPILGSPVCLTLLTLTAVALGGWATVTFAAVGLGTPVPLDPPLSLVTSGPYAFVRNPMQISGVALGTALVLYHPTLFMMVYVADMAVMSLALFQLFENGEMERQWGEEFLRYRASVRNWIPTLSPYRQPASDPGSRILRRARVLDASPKWSPAQSDFQPGRPR